MSSSYMCMSGLATFGQAARLATGVLNTQGYEAVRRSEACEVGVASRRVIEEAQSGGGSDAKDSRDNSELSHCARIP